MQLPDNNTQQAIPWVFTPEEKEQLQTTFQSPLVHAYLQSLKHLALSNRLISPNGNDLADVKAANDYMAGQEYTLDALLSAPLYVPVVKTTNQ